MDQDRCGNWPCRKKLPIFWTMFILKCFPTIRDGDTERNVHARLVAACIDRGCAFVHGILNSSSNDVMYGGESNVQFRNGDFVRNDYVAYLKVTRDINPDWPFSDHPTSEQRRGYELTLDVHRKTIDRCRAGCHSR